MPHKDIADLTSDGRLQLHFHSGQWKLWKSDRRFLLVLAGTQGGKTSFGPHWLYREIQRRGPGDYIVCTPTYPLLNLKALPEFLKLFERWLKLGHFHPAGKQFLFSEDGSRRTFGDFDPLRDPQTRVIFGYATDPESLESATAKAAWLDEVGQNKFKLESWEAILRRLSLAEGRVLLTTTPYNLGWLKQQLYDRWLTGDPLIEVSQFESIMNPNFPREEWERAQVTLPKWKFSLYYRAQFERPAGMIYDCLSDQDIIPRFSIPPQWRRFLGMDFGGVNTAGVFFAEEPVSGRLFAYREYKAGGRSSAEHARHLLEGETMVPVCVGGAKSEGQWRQEFALGGLPILPPVVSDVEVGIDRVYGYVKSHRILWFNDLYGTLDQLRTYSRELDANGEPTEKIADKETFHWLDAIRYIIGYLATGAASDEEIDRFAKGEVQAVVPEASMISADSDLLDYMRSSGMDMEKVVQPAPAPAVEPPADLPEEPVDEDENMRQMRRTALANRRGPGMRLDTDGQK